MQTDTSKHQEDFQNKTTANSDLREDLSNYIDKRMELLRLTIYEKSAQTGAFVVYGLILLLLFGVSFLLALLGLAFFIGSYFDSLALGFGILVVVNLLIAGVFIAFGKRFRKKAVDVAIRIFLKIELDEEE